MSTLSLSFCCGQSGAGRLGECTAAKQFPLGLQGMPSPASSCGWPANGGTPAATARAGADQAGLPAHLVGHNDAHGAVGRVGSVGEVDGDLVGDKKAQWHVGAKMTGAAGLGAVGWEDQI